jgi:hypothetical protein
MYGDPSFTRDIVAVVSKAAEHSVKVSLSALKTLIRPVNIPLRLRFGLLALLIEFWSTASYAPMDSVDTCRL